MFGDKQIYHLDHPKQFEHVYRYMCISARDDNLSWPMYALLHVCSRLKELIHIVVFLPFLEAYSGF